MPNKAVNPFARGHSESYEHSRQYLSFSYFLNRVFGFIQFL